LKRLSPWKRRFWSRIPAEYWLIQRAIWLGYYIGTISKSF